MIKTIDLNSLNCPSSTTVRGDTPKHMRGPRQETTVHELTVASAHMQSSATTCPAWRRRSR